MCLRIRLPWQNTVKWKWWKFCLQVDFKISIMINIFFKQQGDWKMLDKKRYVDFCHSASEEYK